MERGCFWWEWNLLWGCFKPWTRKKDCKTHSVKAKSHHQDRKNSFCSFPLQIPQLRIHTFCINPSTIFIVLLRYFTKTELLFRQPKASNKLCSLVLTGCRQWHTSWRSPVSPLRLQRRMWSGEWASSESAPRPVRGAGLRYWGHHGPSVPQAGSRGCISRPAEGSSHCGKQAIAVLEQVLELSWSRFYGHVCSSVLGGLRRRIWSSMPAYSVVYESETLSWEGKEKAAWFDKDRRIEANLGRGLDRDLFWFFFSFELGSHSAARLALDPDWSWGSVSWVLQWQMWVISLSWNIHSPCTPAWLTCRGPEKGCVYAQAFGCAFMISVL